MITGIISCTHAGQSLIGEWSLYGVRDVLLIPTYYSFSLPWLHCTALLRNKTSCLTVNISQARANEVVRYRIDVQISDCLKVAAETSSKLAARTMRILYEHNCGGINTLLDIAAGSQYVRAGPLHSTLGEDKSEKFPRRFEDGYKGPIEEEVVHRIIQ